MKLQNYREWTLTDDVHRQRPCDLNRILNFLNNKVSAKELEFYSLESYAGKNLHPNVLFMLHPQHSKSRYLLQSTHWDGELHGRDFSEQNLYEELVLRSIAQKWNGKLKIRKRLFAVTPYGAGYTKKALVETRFVSGELRYNAVYHDAEDLSRINWTIKLRVTDVSDPLFSEVVKLFIPV